MLQERKESTLRKAAPKPSRGLGEASKWSLWFLIPRNSGIPAPGIAQWFVNYDRPFTSTHYANHFASFVQRQTINVASVHVKPTLLHRSFDTRKGWKWKVGDVVGRLRNFNSKTLTGYSPLASHPLSLAVFFGGPWNWYLLISASPLHSRFRFFLYLTIFSWWR